ncbi:hypothetical protein JCM10207_007031 [Rhodosporidiobolus poonsookiae]
MGYCRRCGDPISSSSQRCAQCGGLSLEPATKALFSDKKPDRWSASYVSRPSAVGATSSHAHVSTPIPSALPPSSPSLLPPPRPGSPSKLANAFLRQDEDDGELNSVFGSVLSPEDHWQCVVCSTKFKQEEMIYPHPDAQQDRSLAEMYFCRQCFAQRFAKGQCKKCKFAVLSDAPFIKHDGSLWHEACYSCSYCVNPSTSPIIDFAGRPSCEACFDAEAYKQHGIAPSPHLSQSEFLQHPVSVLPPPSRWGRPSISSAAPLRRTEDSGGSRKENVWSSTGASQKSELVGLGVTSVQDAEPKPKAWRVQQERDRSPLVPSLNELGDRLRGAGLQEPLPPRSLTKASTPAPASPSRAVAGTPSIPAQPRPTARPASPAKIAPPPTLKLSTVSTPLARPRGHSPSKSIAERAALFGGSASPGIAPKPTRPAHNRSQSVPVNKPAPTTFRPPLKPLQPSVTSSRPLPSPLQTPSLPLKTAFPASSPAQALPNEPAARSSPASAAHADDASCQICGLELGYGEFVEVGSGGGKQVLHRGCFVCGGCGEELGGGKHVVGEGKWYHQECAPPPPRYRALVTSLAEPDRFASPPSPSGSDSPPSEPPLTLPLEASDPACSACGLALGYDTSVTVPRSAKSFHRGCFKCAKCELPFGETQGERGFVQRGELAYHDKCTPPPASPSPSIRSSPFFTSDAAQKTTPLSSRTSRPLSLSSLPSTSSKPLPPAPAITFPAPTLFARRPRPPSGLGGLLVCAGCGTRATDRETVPGPKSRRYHARCLVCVGCGRALDSAVRESGDGRLRCEGCRRVDARAGSRANSASTTTASPAPLAVTRRV